MVNLTLAEIVISVLTLLLGVGAISLIISSSFTRPRLLSKKELTSDLKKQLISAREEAVRRSTHFENLMVSVGLIQFGILTFVGTKVLFSHSTDEGLKTGDSGNTIFGQLFEVLPPNIFFVITIVLFSAVTGAVAICP